jgi:hypothetical protein
METRGASNLFKRTNSTSQYHKFEFLPSVAARQHATIAPSTAATTVGGAMMIRSSQILSTFDGSDYRSHRSD